MNAPHKDSDRIFVLFPQGDLLAVRYKTHHPTHDSSRREPVFSLLDILVFQYPSFWDAKGFFIRNEPYGPFKGYRPIETNLSSYF